MVRVLKGRLITVEILDRIMKQVESLEKLTSEATKAQDEGKLARSVKSACDNFVKAMQAAGEDADWNKLAAIHQRVEVATGVAQAVSLAMGSASGSDRTEGDAHARALTIACQNSWLEGETRDHVEALVKLWNDTAPKGKGSGNGGSRASTGESKKDLPFPIRIKCESHDWSATQSTTKNSLKWAAVLHHEKEHGHKFGRGDAINQGVVEAIDAVIGGAMHAQGGGYLVDNAS